MQQPPPQQPPPQLPWGYRPPQPPRPPRPWYLQPLGIFAIITAALLVIGLLANAFTGGGGQAAPAPPPTAPPGTFTPPPVSSTSTTVPASLAERLRQDAQARLGPVGTVTAVDAEPGGRVTVAWEIAEAATMGLTKNNARLGVLRIMAAVKQAEAAAGDDYQDVRLLGRFRLPGGGAPTTVVRLRFAKATVQQTDFSDLRYLEAYELADAATVNPAFRG
ncbi:MAG TPA: hypothetical protein VFC13_24610 [Actinomycetes bacterium]|nr:hypothetical protein [Actinomycetes bacterium]